jgi:excisionase family DNA binding protein
MPIMNNKNLISSSELAKILGVTRVTVFRRIKSGEIKAIKVGRNFVIDKKNLPGVLVKTLLPHNQREIDRGFDKLIKNYGETLRLLGKEYDV